MEGRISRLKKLKIYYLNSIHRFNPPKTIDPPTHIIFPINSTLNIYRILVYTILCNIRQFFVYHKTFNDKYDKIL